MAITISVLDQSPLYEGNTPENAFANTIELARKSEALGFKRFWVSEHHDTDNVVGSSPEVLISHLLAKTDRIRIGSGGVMLQHYSPYKVAENFHVLSSLAPGRVDLGIGRAPGGLPLSTKALQRSGNAGELTLSEKLSELRDHVHRNLPNDHLLAGVKATPIPTSTPDIFLLGASVSSAELAGQLGLPYVYSLLLNGNKAEALEAIRAYRDSFIPGYYPEPEVLIALSVVVADLQEEAEELAPPKKIYRVTVPSGKNVNLDTLERAEEYGNQSGEEYKIVEREVGLIKGTKDSVGQQLLELQNLTGVSEFVVSVTIPSFEKRLRSFELLSEAVAEVPQSV